MKKILLALLVISLATSANAWVFNHSYVDPNLINNTCTSNNVTPNGPPSTYSCCIETTCSKRNSKGDCVTTVCSKTGTATKQGYSQDVWLPVVNETCYHPTCYTRAVGLVMDRNEQVQPLTNNADVIYNEVSWLGVSGQLLYAFRFYQPKGLDENGKQSYATLEVQYPQHWYVPTGTSAMQGLLWSWRMLSNKWQGYWQGQSYWDYNGDSSIAQRAPGGSLPSSSNTKNIVVISDGIDSDGPDYKPGGRTITPVLAGTVTTPKGTINEDDATVNANAPYQQSVGFRAASKEAASSADIYETCDAHAPIASITKQDYINVCTKMRDEGIRVNVILYLYGKDDVSDGRLEECAHITGGIVLDQDVTPDNIQTKLASLLATIATQQIKLVK